MHPRLYSEADIASFEASNGIRLPLAYVQYLLTHGAGSTKHVDLLEEWCQPYSPDEMASDFLAQPFLHRQAWNDRSLTTGSWDAPYFDHKWFQGSMRIVNTGCEGYYLLVVSGHERGTVWADQRASFVKGIYPLLDQNGDHMSIDEFLRLGRSEALRRL